MNTKRERMKENHSIPMSAKTKEFLQKICYRDTVSVDMTKHGFIKDGKACLLELLNNKTGDATKKCENGEKKVTQKPTTRQGGDKQEVTEVQLTDPLTKTAAKQKIKSTKIIRAP
nr:uncharacterized protein LOC116768215 [Danaus plexippus plexippus]